jgi:histidyl-tRNA synthetase
VTRSPESPEPAPREAAPPEPAPQGPADTPPEAPRFPLQAVRGTRDVLPAEAPAWQRLEAVCRGLFARYGFSEIRTPVFEATPLFARSIGQETDIVEKEMYTFPDKGGQSLSLRPEGTAGVIRAYLQHGLQSEPLTLVYYLGPMFRHERPQAGRLRQFHQVGVEVIGSERPAVDVEVLALLADLFDELEVGGLALEINAIGDPECRPAYVKRLAKALEALDEKLCANCRRRRTTNPLRVLDCKVPSCREATADVPLMLDHLCPPCAAHFSAVRAGLEGLAIDYVVNPRLVRGLDYYTRTAFEWTSGSLGAQNTVAAGGRYDGLVEDLGGPPRPGIGFALGVERVLLLMPEAPTPRPDLYAALLGPGAEVRMLPVLRALRRAGVTVTRGFDVEASLKAQLKRANKLRARFCLIVGENELAAGAAQLKDMDGHSQLQVAIGPDVGAVAADLAAAVRGAGGGA